MKRLINYLILILLLVFASSTMALAKGGGGGRSFSSPSRSFSSPSRSFSSPSKGWSSPSKSASPSKSGGWFSSNTKPATAPKASAGSAAKTATVDKAKSRAAYDTWQRDQRQYQKPASTVDRATAAKYTPANYRYNPERRAYDSKNFYSSRNYTPPVVIHQMAPSYGVFDNLAMFYMLSHINQPNYAAMAYANRDSEDMKKWRADAEAAAKDNAELKAQLVALDAKVSEMKADPNAPKVAPGYVPKEMGDLAISDAVLKQAPKEKKEESHWLFWTLMLTGVVGVGGYLMFGRRW